MQLLLKHEKPTCHDYDDKKFDEYELNWNLIYRIHHIARYETNIRIFQYKFLTNVLYLNKKLFHFGIISQSKCSLCELYDKSPQHPFHECAYAQNFWNHLDYIFQKKLHYEF